MKGDIVGRKGCPLDLPSIQTSLILHKGYVRRGRKRGLEWTEQDFSEEEQMILNTDPMSFAQSTPVEVLACIQQIYRDPLIKQLIEKGSTEFYLLESTK